MMPEADVAHPYTCTKCGAHCLVHERTEDPVLGVRIQCISCVAKERDEWLQRCSALTAELRRMMREQGWR